MLSFAKHLRTTSILLLRISYVSGSEHAATSTYKCLARCQNIVQNSGRIYLSEIPKRTFLQKVKNKPKHVPYFKKDGVDERNHELIYSTDDFFKYRLLAASISGTSVTCIILLGYMLGRGIQDDSWSDILTAFKVPVVLPFLMMTGLLSYWSLARCPYRIYREVSNRYGVVPKYVAVVSHRAIFTKLLHFEVTDYKPYSPTSQNVLSLLSSVLGNAVIKDKRYLIFTTGYVSSEYYNELNGFTQ